MSQKALKTKDSVEYTILQHYIRRLFKNWSEQYDFPLVVKQLVVRYCTKYDNSYLFAINNKFCINIHKAFCFIDKTYLHSIPSDDKRLSNMIYLDLGYRRWEYSGVRLKWLKYNLDFQMHEKNGENVWQCRIDQFYENELAVYGWITFVSSYLYQTVSSNDGVKVIVEKTGHRHDPFSQFYYTIYVSNFTLSLLKAICQWFDETDLTQYTQYSNNEWIHDYVKNTKNGKFCKIVRRFKIKNGTIFDKSGDINMIDNIDGENLRDILKRKVNVSNHVNIYQIGDDTGKDVIKRIDTCQMIFKDVDMDLLLRTHKRDLLNDFNATIDIVFEHQE